MDFQTLKDQIAALDESRRKKYNNILALSSLGGQILPELHDHAEQASTFQEFFEALYQDDSLKFTKAWAAYVGVENKKWLDRFEPVHKLENIRLNGRGLPIEFAEATMLVPLGGRGKLVNLYVFEDGTINEDVPTFFTSVAGKFTCDRLEFDGIYDIFISGNAIIFERWALNEKGERVKAAELAKEYRRTG